MYANRLINVSTGNPATVLDKYDSTVLANNARNPLGTKHYDPAIPFKAWRYVRYQSTANVAVQAGPAVVWWTDNTYTTVTSTVASEAMSRSQVAGILAMSTAAASGPLAGLTGAAAATLLNGNFVFVQVCGHLAGCLVAALTDVGDYGFATQANWGTTGGFSRVQEGLAITDRPVFFAETAVGAGVADVFITVEI